MAAVLFLSLSVCSTAQHTDSGLLEAVRWYTGEAGMVDDRRARELLEGAASDGDALSVMWLARVYSTGRMTFAADKPRAIELAVAVIDEVEQLAMAGNAEANFLMGTAYAEGLGKPVDAAAAVYWYRRAAAAGVTLAQHNLGNVYESGTGVVQSDTEAARWWRLAADKGDAITQLRLGEAYEQGRGVERDLESALYWYQESARRGNQAATAALARLQVP